MCGIVGLMDLRGARAFQPAVLDRMNQAQLHRGPDEGGRFLAPGVALGHRRLSIIDLKSGQQPLGNEDGSVQIVYNGEIYNFRDLVKELEAFGHRFRTRSDTEVIVHAWEQWGRDCVRRFNGMFAFALWDGNRHELYLARDRIGKKPLFYAELPDGTFAFASELKSILVLPQLRREIDPLAVEEYLAFGYVADPRTILKGVSKLPPATTMVLRAGEALPAPQVYWDVSPNAAHAATESQVAEELISRLRAAVGIRLVSEVPLGAFLSGGVDSSAVVAMMAQHSSEPVNTCAIGFDDPAYDETAYAQQVASRYQTRHYVETVDPNDFDLIDTLAATYDEPFADSSAIPTYRVCQLARKHVTVALSGDGGDENFAGYRRYRMHLAEERARSALPLAIRQHVFGPLGRWYPKLDRAPRIFRAKSTFQALSRSTVDAYFHSVSIIRDDQRAQLLSPEVRRDLQGYQAAQVMRDHARRAPRTDALSLVQYLDIKTYLPGDILVKVDRASMAHSLEVRVPMLDYTLIDWAFSLPADVKLRGAEGKYILKKSLEPYLPNDVLYRKKMGFAVPVARWFRGPLRAKVRSTLLSGPVAESGLFQSDQLTQLIGQHESGARDNSAALWTLLMFGASFKRLFQ